MNIDKKFSLLKPTIIVAFCTLGSRLSGLVRELFVAAYFGTGIKADSINIAIKLPNLFRRIFGEGALSLAFIPIFNKQKLLLPEQALTFAGNVFWVLFFVLTILTAILEYFMPNIIATIAPGFCSIQEKFDLTVWLSRITLPYLILICLVAVCGGILNSIGKFAAFAVAPVILNLTTIAALYYTQDIATPELSFCVAMPIAGLIQILFILFCLKQNGISLAFRIPAFDHNLKKMLKEMIPATISAGTSQLSLFISQIIASIIPGAISIISYAERIYQIPLSLIGTSISTVLLPVLSKVYHRDSEEASEILIKALKWGLLLSLPCATGMGILAIPTIELIYQHGAFTPEDTILTAQVMQGLCLGIPAFVVNKIFSSAFYADKRGNILANLNIIYLILNTILTMLLSAQLKLVGLALSSAIAGWVNVALLLRTSKKLSMILNFSSLFTASYKIFTCTAMMGIFTHLFYWSLRTHLTYSGILFKFTLLASSIVIGVLAYAVCLICSSIFSLRGLKFNI